MSDVIVINPTKQMSMGNKLKVAAYVRVSSDSDDQENSFITQYDYYNNLINANPDWIYVDIYADNGITGTELTHRDEFNRMYEDCADGKIDLILTKSVSRFARNTYDCVDTVRKLKMLGADVIFEKENINTANMNTEVELAALGSIAQEESMSLSKNVRMGIQFRMKNGTFKQGNLPYGYYVEDDEWKIREDQAKVVRIIFKEYIDGKSMKKIADELSAAGIVKNNGKTDWDQRRISYIIKNERYKGDALFQKSYTEDFPFKSKINRGERDMYYIKNYNPPIVSAEIFDKANALLKNQAKIYCPNQEPRGYILSKKIYCSECGTLYRRKSGDINVYWVCRSRDHDSSKCVSTQISEKAIYNGFVNVYNRLINNIEYILTPLKNQLEEYKMNRLRSMGEIENINREIASLTEQILVQEKARAAGYIESAFFMEQSNIMNTRICKLKKDKKALLGSDECEQTIRKTDALVSIIKMNGPIGEFDRQLFKKTVKKIWVDKDKNISYELINGLKLTINQSEVI